MDKNPTFPARTHNHIRTCGNSTSKPSSWDLMVLIPLLQTMGQTAGQGWHHPGLKSSSWKSGDHLEQSRIWEVATRSMDEGRTRGRRDQKKSILWFWGSKAALVEQQEKQIQSRVKIPAWDLQQALKKEVEQKSPGKSTSGWIYRGLVWECHSTP